MALEKWVQKFKEPKTEIKCIKGGYYKYQVSYRYNAEKKRTDKITGVLLGKITEKQGFIPSDKNIIRLKKVDSSIDIKTFGLYHLFFTLVQQEFDSFNNFFSREVSEQLFCFAMFRWAYNTPIKRVPHYYDHDFCSQEFSNKHLTDKNVSGMLKLIGENRTKVVDWMKSLLGEQSAESDEYVMMDSTHVISKSELLTVNAKGYNPDFDFEKQIRLMYLFSAKMQKPVYYRLIKGNITDIKSMALCVEEMKVENVIYIADKGFYSKNNIKMMKELKLQYIVPLHRNNALIDFKPLCKANFKQQLSYFIYNQRIVWYYKYSREGDDFITFLDEGLRAKEEADYVGRITTLPEIYTTEKFEKKLTGFGTLTFSYDIKSGKPSDEIYYAYKQRNEIEVVFDAYKNFLKADVMYMQDYYVTEGWLAANFIAMIAYYKLFAKIREVKKLDKYSPKDIIEIGKSVHKLKIGDQWKLSEITKKTLALFKLLGIDYLNRRS